ncbi:MAG: hypothetical protein IJ274_06300 [Lachnospiraceae bacterium]|nr:hypothetical protein [Lachnospiraceae bacterium]
MKKKMKKNQIMITALALMIAVAGYMQFSGNYLNKEELADGGNEQSDVTTADDMQEYTAELDIVTDEEEVVTMLDMNLSDVNMELAQDASDVQVNSSDVVTEQLTQPLLRKTEHRERLFLQQPLSAR